MDDILTIFVFIVGVLVVVYSVMQIVTKKRHKEDHEELDDAIKIIEDIDSWAKAYPEKVFP